MPDLLIQTILEIPLESSEAMAEWIETQTNIAPSVYSTPESNMAVIAIFQEPDDPGLLNPNSIREFIQWLNSCGLETAGTTLIQKDTQREDWAESWKSHFHPIQFGSQLVIRPSWVAASNAPGVVDIVLDPGLSFGTGHHQTTNYCLERIVSLTSNTPMPASFLDAGTGSGILAIAAAKLGIPSITAFDNDPESIRVASENAAINQVDFALFVGTIGTGIPEIPPKTQYDLIAANILAETLIECAAQLCSYLAPGGSILTAGILETQFDNIYKAFQSQNLTLTHQFHDAPWKSGTFTKPNQ